MSSNLPSTSTSKVSNLIDDDVYDLFGIDGSPFEQRRLRHLTNITIKNLNLNPTSTSTFTTNGLYNLNSSLHAPPPSTSTITMDRNYLNSEGRRKEKGKGKEILNNNNNLENNNEISLSNSTSTRRNRSASINTIDSTLTIRPSPNLPDYSLLPEEELEEEEEDVKIVRNRIRTEQEIRIENMRNKLLDCFISISLVSPTSISSSSSPPSTLQDNDGSRSNQQQQPIFISPPSLSKLHPSFEIDPFDFMLPPGVRDIEDWIGLREERIKVDVWVRKQDEKEQEEDWEKLVVWDVEFGGLICLGKDPTNFPTLPSNTLLFRLNPSNDYYTTPNILPTSTSIHQHSSSSSSSSSSDSDEQEEESGTQSDPNAEISSSLKLKRKEKELERKRLEIHRRRKELEDLLRISNGPKESVRDVEAAGLDRVVRSIELQRELREVRQEVDGLYTILDENFEEDNNLDGLEREQNELKIKLDDLQVVHGQEVLKLDEYKTVLRHSKESLQLRRTLLREATEFTEALKMEDLETDKSLREYEILCQNIQQLTQSRRTQLITLLSHLFPIEPSPSSPSSLLFTIHSLPLPNTLPSTLSSTTSSYSTHTEIYSSALGYVALLVSLLATYLSVPLCYEIRLEGSRSFLIDSISRMKGPRAFPLYGEGVERYRFDYGVFLLNKNIEQLMYSQGLVVLDLRNTLPNLKSLILSLSYDPSHSSFHSSTYSLSSGFELSREENVEEPINSSIQVYNASSSSDSSDDYSPSSSSFSDEESHNREQRGQPPALPPKSPATTIRPVRSESIKSNSSSVRTITKSSSNGNKGNGVVEKLVIDSTNEGGVVIAGVGGGAGKKSAWRVGKLV